MTLTVASLKIYPIKSCAGTSVEHMDLDERGPRGDRRWMLVNSDGEFLTQREFPRLSLVEVEQVPQGIRLNAPGQTPLDVARPDADGRDFVTRVWDDAAPVRPASRLAAQWFSDFLQAEVMLVYQPDDAIRPMRAEYAGAIREARHVSLSDGAPLLLIGQASLDGLNERLADPVPMNRFRPNVVVTGAAPFAEDTWQRIRIGDVTCEVAKPCARCATTTVDQSTGVRGVEPLRTLATFRKREGGVMFGQNLAHHAPGALHVGDVVTVLAP